MLVLVVLAVAVFARGMQGIAVRVTVVDDAVVRWLAGPDLPGFQALMRALSFLSSWWVLNGVLYALIIALLVLRRFRHLIIWLILTNLLALVGATILGPVAQRPRPFGVEIREGWGGWAMPSMHVTYLALGLVTLLYTLVPGGPLAQHRQVGGDGADRAERRRPDRAGRRRPTDVLVGVALGVTIPLLAFRWFTPNEVFPITYRRGRGAHLDVGGAAAGHPARAWRTSSAWSPPRSSRSGCPGRPARPRCGSPSQATRPRSCSASCTPEPPALGPLVQARPRAAVRPPGGREAVQHRPPPGPAGGLRPVADAAGRAAQPHPATASSSSPPSASTCWSPSSSPARPSSARPRSTPR
jgi:hypothetical protein